MKKLLLALMLILCLTCSSAMAAKAPEYTSGHYVYTLLDDGTAKIVDFLEDESILVDGTVDIEGFTVQAVEMQDGTTQYVFNPAEPTDYTITLAIPAQLDGYPVSTLGGNSFNSTSMFSAVIVPEGVTTIDYNAFDSTCVDTITLPESLTSIDDGAFSSCDFTTVTLPEGVTFLGRHAFHRCYDLTSVNIPYALASIGDSNPFMSCKSLTEIRIAEDHPVFEFTEGALISKPEKKLVSYLMTAPATSYAIPEGIESVGWYAFYHCNNLTSITIPASMTTISDGAFNGCQALTSIIIPEGVTDIGFGAFSDCKALASVTLPQSLTALDKYAFSESGLTSIVIPEGVTSIADYAFLQCKKLTSVTLPASITEMGRDVFYDCANLESVTVTPGSYAEKWCKQNDIHYSSN